MEIAREVRRGRAGRVEPLSYTPHELIVKPLLPLGDLSGCTYLRFSAVDRPGVLGKITGILGDSQISIESMIQKGRGETMEPVSVLIRTHPARESALREALDKIDQLSDVTSPTRLIRIEEEM